MVRDYRCPGTERWCQAQVKAKVGPKTYHVQVGGSNLWKRHVEQMIKGGIKFGSDQLGDSGPGEDSEGPPPIIYQEAVTVTTNPTPTLPNTSSISASPVTPQIDGRSDETREATSLINEEHVSHSDQGSGEGQSCDGNTSNPFGNVVPGPAVPAADGQKKKHAREGNPIKSTRSGRIVRKPARYREEGEKM